MNNNLELNFSEIINMIETRRNNAYRKVNEELISLYWDFGKYISEKVNDSNWGDKIVDKLVDFMKREYPTMKGFTRPGIYRMKQFYETYKDNEIVSTLLRQISWSNNVKILSSTNSIEEKEFYIRMCIKNNYTARELDRQIASGYFHRYMLSDGKTNQSLTKAVGEEYRVQVGNQDFYIDLLFYNRALSCLVAFELKIDDFKPEYISKMDFYLEALDRQEKKENENPSVGVILCANKDEQVVEYAMSRSLSPTMVSQYTLKLIDKQLLENKLKEISNLVEENYNK